MSTHPLWLKRIVTLGLLLTAAVALIAQAGWFGFGGTHWQEEVLLHDGTKIIVERWHKRGGRHEITSGPPIKEHTITFTLPGTSKTITWHDEYSEDVGSANFVPLALHILNGVPYIVASPYGCLSYNKSGRPNPPYVIFKHGGDAWQRITIRELPAEFKTINLVIGTSNEEKSLNKLGKVSVAAVESLNRYYDQPEYKTILREAVKGAGGGCEELIRYRGYWIMPNDPVGRRMVDIMVDRKTK